MKYYFLIVTAIFYSAELISQNVGIGNPMPTEKLEVEGNIKMSGIIINENYQAPSLLNGWVNFGGVYAPAGFYKDKEQRVHLIGLIKGGTSSMNTVICILPVGYRPSTTGRIIFDILGDNGSARIDVAADGSVVIMGNGSSTWMNLTGISFKAD